MRYVVHTDCVGVRMPAELRADSERMADDLGITLSELARRGLALLVERHKLHSRSPGTPRPFVPVTGPLNGDLSAPSCTDNSKSSPG